MKRMVSLLMAVVLLLTLTACGASNEEGATDSTTTTTTHTDGGESTSTTTAMGEDVDTTITEGEATTTESETTASMENSADKDGSATIATANKTTTTKKKTTATTTQKATTTTKKATTTKVMTTTQNNSDVIYKSHKLIRVERADKTSKVDGEHILDYLLGKNTYFQQGDTLVYQFDFEKGSLADCIIEKQKNARIEISGNMLKITIVKNWVIRQDDYLDVWLKDKIGNRFAVIRYLGNKIFWYDGKLLDETEAMSRMFHIYAVEKHNIEFVEAEAKDDEDKQYTEFMPSITNRPEGYDCDDLFYKNDVDNWVKYLQWLLCEYEKIGIVSWHCQVRGKHVVTVARVA